MSAPRIRPAAAFALDVVAVLLFVAIGRRSHDEPGSVVGGTIAVAAPLLIGLVIGWLLAQAWTSPMTLRSGAIIWVVTVVVGLAMRRLVFDRSIATAFIIVATVVLCLFLLGWRLVAAQIIRHRGE
ncbi:MAG: DUF3054 domain-containing protein [Ilumatobacteraceae bacterium]